MYKRILQIGLLVILAYIFYLILFQDTNFIDENVYEFVSKIINNRNTKIFKMITFFGSTIFIVLLCILAIFINKKRGLAISLNVAIVALSSQIIKRIVRRARPVDIYLITETGFSFPSGHSMCSAAFYGLIIYFIFKSNIKKELKIISIFSIVLLVLAIGISRIYLGVHYTTDVLGGYILAIIHLGIFIKFIYPKIKNV